MPATVMGMGTTYYGQALEEDDGSYVATEWLVILNVPVVPLRSWRLWPLAAPGGGEEAFRAAPVPLHGAHVIKGYGVTAILIVLVALLLTKRTSGLGLYGVYAFIAAAVVLALRSGWTRKTPAGSTPARAVPAAPRAARTPPAPSAASAPAALARPDTSTPALRLKHAVACVKQVADLGSTADGEPLRVAVDVPDGTGLADDDQPVVRATAGLFAVFYAVDEGSHFSFVNQRDLRAVGIGLKDLHAIGLRNLAAQVDGDPGLTLRRTGTFTGLVMGGHFEASLVLLDALWNDTLKAEVGERFVVAVPARDMCAFCDSHSPQAVAALAGLAARVTAKGDHLLTDRLLVREGGRWRFLVH